MDISKLDEEGSSAAGNDLPGNNAGAQAIMRSDSKSDPGRTAVRETFHLPGLSDRYTDKYVLMPNGKRKRESTIHDDFKTDIMGGGQDKNRAPVPTMSRTHWNNYQNYIQTNPEVRQQLNQTPGQFTLKYRVDITSDKKLLNN